MDKSGCFFKTLPTKGLAKKEKKAKGGKRSKQRITVAFFKDVREKVGKTTVTWTRKEPRCFRQNGGASKIAEVAYFFYPKILDANHYYGKCSAKV